MVIEEKDLSGLGGWDCYKKARTYLVADSVLKSSSSALNDNSGGILFTGLVLEGRKKYVCGLKFRSLDDVDNLCRCKRSISDGSVCEHSLAVVLHSIKEAEKSKRKTLKSLKKSMIRIDYTEIKHCPFSPSNQVISLKLRHFL